MKNPCIGPDRPRLTPLILALSSLVLSHCPASKGSVSSPQTDSPITLPPSEVARHVGTGTPDASPLADTDAAGFSWNRFDRLATAAGYLRSYLPSQGAAAVMAWTGSLATCTPGTVSATFLEDTRRRINYFRAQTGLPANIALNGTKNTKCQWAALIMSQQGSLSHTPADAFPANTCVIADIAAHGTKGWGHEAAQAANLALGVYGPEAIDLLILDTGANNHSVGHRRWSLNPRAQSMGIGSVPPSGTQPGSLAQWVIGDFLTEASAPAAVVTWPNAGFVPYQLVPQQAYGGTTARWSCSFRRADWSAATVSLARVSPGPETTIAVTKEAVEINQADPTIVWKLTNSADIPPGPPASDVTWRVTLAGIRLTSGTAPTEFVSTGGGNYSYTYTVTGINPYNLGPGVSITGSPTPSVNVATPYTLSPLSIAHAYRYRASRLDSTAWTEGAENSPAPQITSGVSSAYALRHNAFPRTGSLSFHLTLPTLTDDSQHFIIDRVLVPQTGATLNFYSRLRFMTTTSTLRAQISKDNGTSWTTIDTRSGDAASSSGTSSTLETTWRTHAVTFPADTLGQTVKLRFIMNHNNGSRYAGTTNNHGCYIDDISVTAAPSLVGTTTTDIGTATTFNWTPSSVGTWLLQAEARVTDSLWAATGPITTVTAAVAPTSPVDQWRQTYFPGGATPQSADSADPDYDGLSNLLEYAFGTHPLQTTPANGPASQNLPRLIKNANGTFSIEFTLVNTGGIVPTLQVSSSLNPSAWTSATPTQQGNTYRFTVPNTTNRQFFRATIGRL